MASKTHLYHHIFRIVISVYTEKEKEQEKEKEKEKEMKQRERERERDVNRCIIRM